MVNSAYDYNPQLCSAVCTDLSAAPLTQLPRNLVPINMLYSEKYIIGMILKGGYTRFEVEHVSFNCYGRIVIHGLGSNFDYLNPFTGFNVTCSLIV